MGASNEFLSQWNNRDVQIPLNNGNITKPQIHINVIYKCADSTFRVECRGKKLAESQDLTEVAASIDEIFALSEAAFNERVESAPQFVR